MPTRGRPTTPRAVRRARVRDRLLDAIVRLLAGGGTFADLSINDVVAEAGVAKSTFYQYFTGKNDVLTSFVDRLIEDTGGRYAWPVREGSRSADFLARAIHTQLAAYRSSLPLLAAAFETAYTDPEVRQSVDRFTSMLHDGIEAHIRAGQQGGWVDPTLPPKECAVWLNWMLCRGVHRLVCDADVDDVDALVDELSTMLWSALYAYPRPSRPRSAA
jgi:AcrR family transcriptional regulator